MAEAKRPSISKSLRFEVFKRDSFRCQYCGAAAPDVVLQIDHIRPVADGGDTTIVNLITSCQACNSGKSDRKLSDHSAVQKSRNQLEQLQERREQLEMMMEWQVGLTDLEGVAVDSVADLWSKLCDPFYLNETGRMTLRSYLKKYSIEEVCEAIRTAAGSYLRVDESGTITPESVEKAWSSVGGICRVNRASKNKPYIKDLYYLRGILRRRFNDTYYRHEEVMGLLEAAHGWGISIDELRHIVTSARYWSQFVDMIDEAIQDAKEREGRN